MNDIPNVEDVKVDYSKVMEAQEKKNKKHQPYPATDYKTVKEIFIHSMKNYADETLILQNQIIKNHTKNTHIKSLVRT